MGMDVFMGKYGKIHNSWEVYSTDFTKYLRWRWFGDTTGLFSQWDIHYLGNLYVFGGIYTMWGPPVIIWFISPSNYSYLRTINHSYWSYVHQLGYRTGASHCRGCPVWGHRMVFESTTCLNNTMNVNDMEDRGSQWPVAFDVWYEHTRYTCSTVHVEKTKRLLVKTQGQVQQVVCLSTVMALYQL